MNAELKNGKNGRKISKSNWIKCTVNVQIEREKVWR